MMGLFTNRLIILKHLFLVNRHWEECHQQAYDEWHTAYMRLIGRRSRVPVYGPLHDEKWQDFLRN